jgi:hypothetical protein
MSRKKVKRPKRTKTSKVIVSPRAMMESTLASERAAEREEETSTVERLIIEDKLDPYRIDDYKYLRAVARDVGWSIGRLRRAVKNAKVAEAVEDEKEATAVSTTP